MRTEAEYRTLIEDALPKQLAQLGEMPDLLRHAMDYSLLSGGKRIRPVLMLAAADLLGVSLDDAMPFACAVEMIHTYSLIHDDLPAMDNDDLRRGRPTNHVIYGEGMAILAGDALFHAAMELMLAAAVRMGGQRGLKAALAITRRAGVSGMVAGQAMDISGEGKTATIEHVTKIHTKKTADMLTAPLEAAACLAEADERTMQALCSYGLHIGIAFQMMDDLLDVIGDEKQMGKRAGLDAADDKQTWITLRGVEGTRMDAGREVSLALDALKDFDEQADFLRQLAEKMLQRVK